MGASDGTSIRQHLLAGQVIPAQPLALTPSRTLDERHQRALTRYYIDAGAGGLAVGVHTTQFAIRDPAFGLYRPVLELAMETARAHLALRPRPFVMIAGAVGDTAQAVHVARTAAALGYDMVLLSLGALRDADERRLMEHCRAVADVLPLFGFYLQPAVGGRTLSYAFWRDLASLDRLWAIKIAPFNRYQTYDVVAPRLRDRAWLTEAAALTDANAAIFDAANGFAGCIPGIHEVLRRQGLLRGTWCLDVHERLSPRQNAEIDRVIERYPFLTDDEFVRERLDGWMK